MWTICSVLKTERKQLVHSEHKRQLSSVIKGLNKQNVILTRHHHHHVLYFEKKVDRRNLTMWEIKQQNQTRLERSMWSWRQTSCSVGVGMPWLRRIWSAYSRRTLDDSKLLTWSTAVSWSLTTTPSIVWLVTRSMSIHGGGGGRRQLQWDHLRCYM